MPNLIGFDKNRGNLEFKGSCKLSVNFISNYLFVEPKNEEFKLISSSFEWNYVMKKNLLFVFAEFNFLDFCLEFNNEQMCQKILDNIDSGKKNKEITAPISIDESFIKPIFQTIADNPTFNSDLINVLAKWIQLLDEEDKEKYSNLMKDYGIYDIVSAVIQNQTTQSEQQNLEEKKNRKRRFSQIKTEEILQDERKTAAKPSKRVFTIISSTLFRFFHIRNSHHSTLLIFTSASTDLFHQFKSKFKSDSFKCITCEKKAIIGFDETGEICVKMDSKEHSCRPFKKIPENSTDIKLLRKFHYEIFDNCPGRSKKLLVIFDSVDRSQCYENSCKRSSSQFLCLGCCSKNITYSDISKANIRNKGSEKEYVEIINENHQCEKRKYSPEKYAPIYDFVLKPDFIVQKFMHNGKEGQKLIIFDKKDKNKCYQYYCYVERKAFRCRRCQNLKKCVTATLNQNSEGDEYIILSSAKHACEMRSSVLTQKIRPSVPSEKIILHQPQDFEIIGKTKTGDPRIFIYENNQQKSGYMFYKKKNAYTCVGRNSGYTKGQTPFVVLGKLIMGEQTGKYFFQMISNQIHSCKPRPYQPEKYEIVPKTFDFFYYRLQNQYQTLKLAIYSPENDQLCYTFVYEKAHKIFICMECRKMKKSNSIKPQKDADGKEYFNHNLKKHICKPIKTSSILKSDIPLECGITIKSKPNRKIKMDESKIVRKPNFELRPNNAGDPDQKLIVFYSNDKTFCYEFNFYGRDQIFLCNRCKKQNYVSAKLHKNGKEYFIVKGKNEHVCEPVKYQPK